MKLRYVFALALLVAVGLALMLRSLFPKTVLVAGVPRIETHHDTVTKLDVRWYPKFIPLKLGTGTPNLIERIATTFPETVYVVPPLRGATALVVGPKVGDSTMIGGFSVTPIDSGYERRSWQAQVYTMGPLRSMLLDSAGTPQLTFYPIPGKPCGTFCKLGHYLLGGAVVGGATAIACVVAR